MLEEQVRSLLGAALEDRPDLFLIELRITPSHQIRIVLDGDSGVNLEDCISISRSIEHQLDREDQDFSLEVSSAGASAPLTMPRQYGKHIGRKLKVRTRDGEEVEAMLKEVGDKGIHLTWKAREPKGVGKGKVTVTKEKDIDFTEIEMATVILKF